MGLKQRKKLKIAVFCGGPSLERGISLNSARSVCDHLQSDYIEIFPVYFDHKKKAYKISRAQLYCNTPSDFDFKLHNYSTPFSASSFKAFLKSVDIVFPVMHGAFGEDGAIQRILEKNKIAYIGSNSEACKKCFDKHSANAFIKSKGFYTLPSLVLKSHLNDHKKLLERFFKENKIKRAIVKPASGGSGISVFSVSTVSQAIEKAKMIFNKKIDTRVVVEPFCNGTEFTVIILQNKFGMPVAILPTEMEMDYREHQIFDYRRKYLATNQVRYHCPPRFSDEVIERIQIQAEQLFTVFGASDFARFDGWLMNDGNIWFSDFNPISGMEQNSFLFQQSSQIGFSHSDLLNFVVRNSCNRQAVHFKEKFCDIGSQTQHSKKEINVLFGGLTAERQVSLMTGTNVWLKLRKSEKYLPTPYLLEKDGKTVWKLPYQLTLNHTVEEIAETCKNSIKSEARLKNLRRRVIDKLSLENGQMSQEYCLPEKMDIGEFINKSKTVFIGLHGGIGEDGTLQGIFDKRKIKYNGSGQKASKLCMDKYESSKVLESLASDGIFTAKKLLKKIEFFKNFQQKDYDAFWKELRETLKSNTIIVKPRADGCSAGIVRLFAPQDLKCYLKACFGGLAFVKADTFTNQHGIIDMPTEKMEELMFEEFIETDKPKVIKDKLKWIHKTGWIEVTMGVFGKTQNIKAFNPSLTVSEGNILSLEEKFQGGTGVNITPPPEPYISKKVLKLAKQRMEKVAKKLGINGYARIDAFMNIKTGELIIIEANSTPALTPSTVMYHQALAEKSPMYPIELLEKIVDLCE